MLLVRSTLRVNNSTNVPFQLTLVTGSTVLWECTVDPESDLAIPAQFCHKPNTRMFFQPLISQGSHSSASKAGETGAEMGMESLPRVELPMPEIPGLHKAGNKVASYE